MRRNNAFSRDEEGNALLTTLVVLAGIFAVGLGSYFLIFSTLHLGTHASQNADDATVVHYGYLEFLDGRLETKGDQATLVLTATPHANSTTVNLTLLGLDLVYKGAQKSLTLGATPDASHFSATVARDADKSATTVAGNYTRGDLVEIRIDADLLGIKPEKGELIRVWHVQPDGPSVETGFTFPISGAFKPIERLDRAY